MAMETEMVTKTNPEKDKQPGIGKLRFKTSIMEKILEIEKENKTRKDGDGPSFSLSISGVSYIH